MSALLHDELRRTGVDDAPLAETRVSGSLSDGDIPGEMLAIAGFAMSDVSAALPRAKHACVCTVELDAPPNACVAQLAELADVAASNGFVLAHWEAREAHTIAYLLREAVAASPFRYALALDRLGWRAQALAVLARAEDGRALKVMRGVYGRSVKLEGWGAVAPVADALSSAAGARGWSRERNRILVSIHIQSNNPAHVRRFFARVANSCDDPSRVEVIVKIDDDHVELNEMLPREVARQPFQLKYISTPLIGGFFELWRSMNDMLAITDPSAYFLLNLNDEMAFLDRGWDTRLARYVGLFPDDLFRLRTSIYRNRNYHDHWECGFAPETSAITTKKWIETGGNWNPCLGPDTFQQCVAFYFNRLNWRLETPRQREIPIEDIRFGGEGAYVGLTGASLRRRVRGATKAWFRLMSEEIQTEAAKRAAKLHATINAERYGLQPNAVAVDEWRKVVTVRDQRGVIERIAYGAAPAWYTALNARRSLQFAAFGGGGLASYRPLPISVMSLLALRFEWAERLRTLATMPPESVNELNGVARALRGLARTPYYIAHAPDYLQLFYLRRVRHWLNVLDLIARRGVTKVRNGAWWVFVGGPRRILDHLDLFARRTGGGVLGWCAGVVVGGIRFVRGVFHVAGAGGPRALLQRSGSAVARIGKLIADHADLAARRSYGAAKVLAWRVLIGAPRAVGGHIALAYHRSKAFLVGHADLAWRRGGAGLKTLLWRVLIDAPRRAAAAVSAWGRNVGGPVGGVVTGIVAAPRWIIGHSALAFRRSATFVVGHADLARRRGYAAAKTLAWRAFVAAPRAVGAQLGALGRGIGSLAGHAALAFHRGGRFIIGHADLACRRAFGLAKVGAWWMVVGAPRALVRSRASRPANRVADPS